MAIQEGQFFKKVLGVRLSYLSWHPGVRQFILQRLYDGQNILEIIRDINVDGVHVDVVGDEKDAFAAELNDLIPGADKQPGAGDQYANEAQADTQFNREHRWDWWLKKINENPALVDALRTAVRQVL